jgi:hypothetical protein
MVERRVSIAATICSVSESRAVLFLDSAFDGRFDRGAGAPNLKPEKDCCSVGA